MRKIGAQYLEGFGCTFTVWAPEKETMILEIVKPVARQLLMKKDEEGYFSVLVEEAKPGTQYFYSPNHIGKFPDPASHYQPEGVHGPSEVVNHKGFKWKDHNWRGIPLRHLVIYELHVGTFTNEGSFDAIIDRLEALNETGINTIEIMPVAQFPGERNWGYDGVYPFAVQNSYGGPEGLRNLVDACHQKGIAVILDVVYNHLGPEGNYFLQFGPYYTSLYNTPWGNALNFDGEWSDGVREYFIENVEHWLECYHIDGLRLDAIHAIYDHGAVHFWHYLNQRKIQLEQKMGFVCYLIAESDLNNPKVVKSPEVDGYGFNAQWLDDFHHALYVLLHPEGKKLYEDFGMIEQLAKAYKEGFVHSGEYVKFRKRKYGSSSAGIPGEHFVVFAQNHDQVGNRVLADRSSLYLDEKRLKLAAAAVFLSPYIPLLFMGEEYAEDAPFYYFVSHSDPGLIKAVQEGRRKEFERYKWHTDPPDPQSEETFKKSKLTWNKRNDGFHNEMLNWHKQLIQLRKSHPVFQNTNKNDIDADVIGDKILRIHRQTAGGRNHILCYFNFSEIVSEAGFPGYSGKWQLILDSQGSLVDTNQGNRNKIILPSLSVRVFEARS
jgi:maltooligosyltrehalose trehalohydrolase